MNSETYLNKLRANGVLRDQLQFMADEYLGPCGQSMLSQQMNQIKRAALLEAKNKIDELTWLDKFTVDDGDAC